MRGEERAVRVLFFACRASLLSALSATAVAGARDVRPRARRRAEARPVSFGLSEGLKCSRQRTGLGGTKLSRPASSFANHCRQCFCARIVQGTCPARVGRLSRLKGGRNSACERRAEFSRCETVQGRHHFVGGNQKLSAAVVARTTSSPAQEGP